MSDRVLGSLAAIYLVACLLFGGASAAGAIANATLQLAGVGLLLLTFWTAKEPLLSVDASRLAWIVGLFILLMLLYLIPLPPSLWEQLPGRAATSRGYELLGVDNPSIPISLAPHATVSSLLSFLPPAAMFVLTVRLSARARRRLAWVLLLGGVLSIALSAFQLLGGEGSPLRFYAVTNLNRAVGFFSNANHLTTLIVCALPFTGVLAAKAVTASTAQRRGAALTLGLSMAVFLVVGIVVSGSMAGYALFLPAAFGTFLIYRRAVVGRLSGKWALALAMMSLLFIAVALRGPLNQQAFANKFSAHPTARSTIWETTLRAASEFAPVGSGPGTFSGVYRTFEGQDRATNEYVNHAHNDYLEVALELGLPGLLLVLCFLLWYVTRASRAWKEQFQAATLARTGSVIIGIILLHSLVEYPLRTAALAAVFAMSCGFLVPPPARRERTNGPGKEPSGTGLRHLEVD